MQIDEGHRGSVPKQLSILPVGGKLLTVNSGRKGERGKAKLSEDISLSDISRFLVRRRLILLTCTVLGCALGLIAYIRAPRLYTATAIVEMSHEGNALEDISGAGALVGEGMGFMTDMLTQQSVLMGDSTALSVIKSLNLMATPPYSGLAKGVSVHIPANGKPSDLLQNSVILDRALAIFKSGLKTVPVKNTRLFAVNYTDRDPVRSAAIANAVVEAYLENHAKNRYDATVKASKWMSDQLEALKSHAADTHTQVAALEKKSGVITAPLPANKEGTPGLEPVNSNPEFERFSTLNDELSRAEIARIQKEAAYRLIETNDAGAILNIGRAQFLEDAGGVLNPQSHNMQVLQSLHAQESALDVRLATEEVAYGPKNPIIVEIQKQLDAVRSQIVQQLGRMSAQTKAEYLLAKANEDALNDSLQKTKVRLMALGDDLSTLTFLREEEASNRKLYQDLYMRLEEANMTAGVRSTGIAIDDVARVPSAPSSPVFKNYLAAGLGAGFFVGILAGLLVQVLDTQLYTIEDFERYSPYPLLGVIPNFEMALAQERAAGEEVPDAYEGEAWMITAPRSHLAEGYRQIRTSILLSSVDNPPRVLIVTSAFSGDGKTVTAYNLAAAIATQSTQVLLIGADMRRPTMPGLVPDQDKTGLSDVLSNRVPVEKAVRAHPRMPSLHLLSAGTIPPDPAELLGSKRYVDLIQKLRSIYDYILIDTPPVVPVTDPVIAGAAADAVIAVVRSGKTRKPELNEMWNSLDKPSIRVLGFVVNGYKSELRSYKYSHRDEYGSGKPKSGTGSGTRGT